MTRRRFRTQACNQLQARQRLTRARSFLEVAKMAAEESDSDLQYGSAAASIAVLAGIAAADAACCHALGRRSRSDTHHDAEQLLASVSPGGKDAATQLRKLISLKDAAHYGFVTLSQAELKRSLRQADRLVLFAERVVRG